MDEKEAFDLLIKSQKEEEKEYFFDDPDEEKISFGHWGRAYDYDYNMMDEQEENCSDWDKDCKSKILADLPTNDSNSYIFEGEEEEEQATKFLTRLGLLEKVNNDEIFVVDEEEESLQVSSHDDFELDSNRWRILNPHNEYKNDEEIRFDFEPFENDIESIDLKHKELMDEGLPVLQLEDVETFQWNNSHLTCQRRDSSIISMSGSEMRKDTPENDEDEEMIDTKSSTKRVKKKSTEERHLLERKTFRMLRKYYKSSFETFAEVYQYKSRVRIMSSEEMDQLIIEYMKNEFDFLVGMLEGNELAHMIICLKRIILSDRSQKFERVSLGLDFSTTRTLFNKYSYKAFDEWIAIPTNSIILVHFYLKQGKKLCSLQKDVNEQMLETQMQSLIKHAFYYLPPVFVEIYSQPSCKIINFLN